MSTAVCSKYTIRTVEDSDKNSILKIFNYYIENSFSAYFEIKVEQDFFDLMKRIAGDYPFYVVEDENKEVVGFSMLHSFDRAESFRRVAEVTYFIDQNHTRSGLGQWLLEKMTREARKIGVDTLLASISSLNEQSLKFHFKNGFVECGRFVKIGNKWGKDFDLIWVQKFI
ncbi:MAG: GNAT family N-acetyltransferase [Candidatus Zixiibacteriota bacterium]